MAIKVEYGPAGNWVATCDTVTEAIALMAASPKPNVGSGGKEPKPPERQPEDKTLEEKIQGFSQSAKTEHKRVMKALLKHPQGIRGSVFYEENNISSSSLGGILRGIGITARKNGLNMDELILSDQKFDSSGPYRWLQPAPLLIRHEQAFMKG